MTDKEEAKGEVISKARGERPTLIAGLVQSVKRAFVENAALKFVAFVLALTVFILVHSNEDEVYHPWVQVTYSDIEGRVLVSKRVEKVQITVRGSRRRINRLQKHSLDAIGIDLQHLSSGELTLEPEMLHLPDGIELLSISPPSINLEFDDKIEKTLPVVADFVGVPARGYKVTNTIITPQEVKAVGARRLLEKRSSVSTEEIRLDGRTQSFKGPVSLITNGFDLEGAKMVHVQVSLIDELEARELSAKDVAIRAPPGTSLEVAKRFTVTPGQVAVTMYGPVRALEAIDDAKVVVVAELSSTDLIEGQERLVELRVEPALTDIAYKIIPDQVMIRPR